MRDLPRRPDGLLDMDAFPAEDVDAVSRARIRRRMRNLEPAAVRQHGLRRHDTLLGAASVVVVLVVAAAVFVGVSRRATEPETAGRNSPGQPGTSGLSSQFPGDTSGAGYGYRDAIDPADSRPLSSVGDSAVTHPPVEGPTPGPPAANALTSARDESIRRVSFDTAKCRLKVVEPVPLLHERDLDIFGEVPMVGLLTVQRGTYAVFDRDASAVQLSVDGQVGWTMVGRGKTSLRCERVSAF